MSPVSKYVFGALLGLAGAISLAAPFTPSSDAEVVERLPTSTNDPAMRRVESLRKQLNARPNDAALRIEVARRYFDLAMAQGDPRYVGYASAALGPLAATEAGNPAYWLAKGLVQQYNHDFAGALQSLTRSSDLDPQSAEPIAWRAAIHMVQAQYPQALGECTRLVPLTSPLQAQGCTAYVQANTGNLAAAYESLNKALLDAGNVDPGLSLWLNTRLAEMALRLEKPAQAEAHFREALKLGVTDQFLLAAYADFLIEQKRPAEAIKLLADWERSDVLLLRLAFAGKAANDARSKNWADQLKERFAAALLHGDRLHEQEAARFALDIENDPRKALDLAVSNYASQKEPRDAEILMRAAIAAKQPRAAAPAISWFRESKYEDPRLAALAAQLTTPGGGK